MPFSAFFQRLGEENPPCLVFSFFGVFVLFLFYPLYTSLIIFIRMCDDEGDEEREEQVYNTDYQVWQDGGRTLIRFGRTTEPRPLIFFFKPHSDTPALDTRCSKMAPSTSRVWMDPRQRWSRTHILFLPTRRSTMVILCQLSRSTPTVRARAGPETAHLKNLARSY